MSSQDINNRARRITCSAMIAASRVYERSNKAASFDTKWQPDFAYNAKYSDYEDALRIIRYQMYASYVVDTDEKANAVSREGYAIIEKIVDMALKDLAEIAASSKA